MILIQVCDTDMQGVCQGRGDFIPRDYGVVPRKRKGWECSDNAEQNKTGAALVCFSYSCSTHLVGVGVRKRADKRA